MCAVVDVYTYIQRDCYYLLNDVFKCSRIRHLMVPLLAQVRTRVIVALRVNAFVIKPCLYISTAQ